jgi:hypothetical protein
MEQVLQLAVIVFAALATGGLMVNWIGLGRAMSRLSVSTYVEFHQATNRTFDPYMPIVVVGANRSRAGQCRARQMTGRPFAPLGFDFTFCALFFRSQDWPAAFLLVL